MGAFSAETAAQTETPETKMRLPILRLIHTSKEREFPLVDIDTSSIGMNALRDWLISGKGRELDEIAQREPSPQERYARKLAEIFSPFREEASVTE